MGYNHNYKAGNQGDMVKHPALIAAVDGVLAGWTGETFRYADTFAGHASNPLVDGPDYEWPNGVGRLADRAALAGGKDAVATWVRRYLGGPQISGLIYPGSAAIAAGICAERGRQHRLALWDISPDALASLRRAFGGGDHAIHDVPATTSDADVGEADFLLIDPPGIGRDKGFPSWAELVAFLDAGRDREQAVLMWLPVNANTTVKPPAEDGQSRRSRQDALARGYDVSKVRWYRGGRTIGCQLLYRLPATVAEAVRKTVDRTAAVAGWQNDLSEFGIEAVVHYLADNP